MMTIHKSVLLNETVEALNLKNGSVVVDATLGGGGHSREILKRILPDGKLIAFDQDEKAIENFQKKIDADEQLKKQAEKIILINENFENIKESLERIGISSVNGITADLGISSDQLDDSTLGISFRIDAPLDMRMDRKRELTAERVVNEYSEENLKKILLEFGDEKYANRIAGKICKEREIKKITRTLEVVSIIEKAVPAAYRYGKINCATKTFQALRIEVNNELGVLRKIISDGVDLLASGGRLAIITFHSGEDRIVKNVFREYARGCICPPEFPICQCGKKEIAKIITRKPIEPGGEEVENNPRARSGKLRVLEKI
ncbi:MAG TPA: 16S rRNA (cytosine(1402)-N(4))-methyltransferase [Candidatus Moranbacteria bacterium]|nr:16S rRNA (cytosine(1402)-N(4))-methyltransferase [Candidatus Moranbacteria bacterium]